nr:MAG TPA: hypothetical protein [Caudoviricetes sp.]
MRNRRQLRNRLTTIPHGSRGIIGTCPEAIRLTKTQIHDIIQILCLSLYDIVYSL